VKLDENSYIAKITPFLQLGCLGLAAMVVPAWANVPLPLSPLQLKFKSVI